MSNGESNIFLEYSGVPVFFFLLWTWLRESDKFQNHGSYLWEIFCAFSTLAVFLFLKHCSSSDSSTSKKLWSRNKIMFITNNYPKPKPHLLNSNTLIDTRIRTGIEIIKTTKKLAISREKYERRRDTSGPIFY